MQCIKTVQIVYFRPIVPRLMLMNSGTAQYIASLDDRGKTKQGLIIMFVFNIWVISDEHTFCLLIYSLSLDMDKTAS